MFLPGQSFGEPVRRHFGCRKPFYLQPLFLNFLAEPVLVDIDVLKLCDQFGSGGIHETDSLLVVALDFEVMLELKG
jgi:hypothetical protein